MNDTSEDPDPCKGWTGIECMGGTIWNIYLRNNNLKGKIPASLGGLKSLWILDLGENFLQGEIPVEGAIGSTC
jgi:hypothetical protein